MAAGLQSPDIHCLHAAEGWLELGNPQEALAELDRISAVEQGRMEVLSMRWSVLAGLKSWEACVTLAERIVTSAPKHVFGWIHRSFALHELKRTQEARDLLLPAVKQFPRNETIPYNLACYECQLGDLPAAKEWLMRAMRIRNPAALRIQALADVDLKPLWGEIRTMTVTPR